MAIIPRTAGVSSNSRLEPMRLSPRPLRHSRCFGNRPQGDLTSLIFTVFTVAFSISVSSKNTQAVISATVLPRLAAIIFGERMFTKASNVACTTFTGLVEP